jgi:hypothetical protein
MLRMRWARKLADSPNTAAEMSLSATWLAMAGAPAAAWLVLSVTAPRADRRYA